ncbi:hypothetical protein LguiA_018198 [Lonicera macranthoides]
MTKDINMNDCRGDKECCYFHPKEIIVGVCHLCLYEKLLILSNNNSNQTKPNSSTFHSKIFALGSLIHHRFESRHRKSDNSDSDASTSHEDSFISIKFEKNGVGSWDRGKVSSKVSIEQCNKMPLNKSLTKEYSSGPKTVVEHVKARSALRWRKRIGHLFQLGAEVCGD